ncbi:Ferrochelatase [Quillaja saponaria]|uniref:protoporphyrin ferrochelatase n=1 Tax=Quillaja saponaria TaxID=32244 RepID=A0AAD7PIR5_QUISA|nr:Ferrochelatase [Quillaja saponaria]
MNSPIQTQSSTSSSSSYMFTPHSCLTSASRNCKFPVLFPRAMWTSHRLYRCSGVYMETRINSDPSKDYIGARYSLGCSEAQCLVSKQSWNNRSCLTSLLTRILLRLPRLFRFLQKPLAQFISVLRAPKSKEGYASIGGGSPLRHITDAQAEELRKSLWEKNVPAKVYVGMRYWHPFTEEAIEQIKRDRITKLVVLPLYPQFSISTSGSSLRLLESIFREDEYLVNMQHTVIPSWYQREGYSNGHDKFN